VSLVDVYLVTVYKLWDSHEVCSSVQFLIHASSSNCICLVWRICMTPCAFLMCTAPVSGRILAEPFWKARDLPQGVRIQCESCLTISSEKYIAVQMLHKTRIKCFVRAYTSYVDIELLLVHPYVVQRAIIWFTDYTTYENILHRIWQMLYNLWQNMIQHDEKISNNISCVLHVWLKIRQHMTTN